MSYKFLGHGVHGGTLVIGDKAYKPGDNVPLSKDAMLKHQAAGLVFEGVEDAADEIPAIPPTPQDNRPRDDAGAIVPTDRAGKVER